MCKGRWFALFPFVFVLLLALPGEKSLAQSSVTSASRSIFESFEELIPTRFAIDPSQKGQSDPLATITFESATASGCQKTIQFKLDSVLGEILPRLTCRGEYSEHHVNRRSDDDIPADQRGILLQFGYGEAMCTVGAAQDNLGQERFAISLTYTLNGIVEDLTGCHIPLPILVSTTIDNSHSGSRSTAGLSTLLNIGMEWSW